MASHFLIDASLPRGTDMLVREAGFEATDVRDIGMGAVDDLAIAAYAHTNQLCILSRDLDFGDIRTFPPERYAGIVVFRAPHHAARTIVLEMVRQLFRHHELLEKTEGCLIVVDSNQIRSRRSNLPKA